MPEERQNAAKRWSRLMQQKLDANAHKGGWLADSSASLWDRVQEELDELIRETDSDKVELEAADVANMAFMFAEVRKRELAEGNRS